MGVEFLGYCSEIGDDFCIDCVGGLWVFNMAIKAVYTITFVVILEHLSNSIIFLN
jgi:hypothetical protein